MRFFSSTDCTYNGDTYRPGDTWKPYGLVDPCFECTCLNGEFDCHTIECPALECDPSIAEAAVGECCPVCPGK